jgi:hypothetical protein
MAKNALPKWFDKLKLDKQLDAYKCNHKLGKASIDILLFADDRKLVTRQNLAIEAERVLSQWPVQNDRIIAEIRIELKKEKRITRQNESTVSPKTVLPFSLSVFQNDAEDYYSYGLNILGTVLEDDEYIDYSRDVAHTWTTIDVASTED